MTGLTNTLGRGLLILALASCAFACGDDDGGGKKPTPDGGEAGSGGSGGGDADGGAGTGSVSVATCVADAKTTTMNMTSDACLTCACTEDTAKVTACDATCWGLINCFGSPALCGDVDTSDMNAAVSCLSMKCPTLLAGAQASSAPATALGAVLSSSCSTECAPAGATDGGTPGDGGPDGDGGADTDGGN